MVNFIQIVNEALLLEDPDHAVYKNIDLDVQDSDARPFFVATVTFKSPKAATPVLFYAVEGGQTHPDVHGSITYELDFPGKEKDPIGWTPWECYPKAIKNQIETAIANWNQKKPLPFEIEDPQWGEEDEDLPSGRFWIKNKTFFVSMWKGTDSNIKKWLTAVLPTWNPNKFPIKYQPEGADEDYWIDGDAFLGTITTNKPSNKSPEVIELQKEINNLLPRVHVATGPEKQKIKTQIKTLQNKIKSLGGISKSTEYVDSSKGSYKQAQIANKMSVAHMKALSQTSESYKNSTKSSRCL